MPDEAIRSLWSADLNVGKSRPQCAARPGALIVGPTFRGRRVMRSTPCSRRRPQVRTREHRGHPAQAQASSRESNTGQSSCALEAANRGDIALVLVDSEGVVEHDLTVADVARKAQCSTLAVLSKWISRRGGDRGVRARWRARLRQRPPVSNTSAKTGRGIARLLERIALYDKHSEKAARRAQPRSSPSCAKTASRRRGRSRLKLLYGTQTQRPAAALPLLRQRPEPVHARLRLLGGEPDARALLTRGRSPSRSTSSFEIA